MQNYNLISGLKEIAHNYDSYIVDLWGVIHDGIETYPHAANTLAQLRRLGKEIIFLSNAPRRASSVFQKLDQLNIERALYDDIITSGEALFDVVKNNELPFLATAVNQLYYYVGPERDVNLLAGTDWQRTVDLSEAAFLLITGFIHDDNNIDEHMPILQQARQLNIPVLSANPDLIVVRKSGNEWYCGGKLARIYREELGGKVYEYGKPYSPGYVLSLEKLKKKKSILAIGDSFATDIIGANKHNIDSLLITQGIHQEKLHKDKGEMCYTSLQGLCVEYNVIPTYVLKELVW